MRFDSRRPQPLVRARSGTQVRGRIKADGSEIEPLAEADVIAAAQELSARGVEIDVLALLHGYRNPKHEPSARYFGRARPRSALDSKLDACAVGSAEGGFPTFTDPAE